MGALTSNAMRVQLGVVAALLMVTASSVAAAQPSNANRAAARELGVQGVEDLQAGRAADASSKLERAFEVVRAPSIGLWSARALVTLGKWVEAAERYLQVTRLDPSSGDVAVQKQAQLEAAKEGQELTARMPGLLIQLRGATATAQVSIDGAPLPPALLGARVPVNPGKHVVEVRDGAASTRRTVTSVEGAVLEVEFDLSGRGAAATSKAPAGSEGSTSARIPQAAATTSGARRTQVIGLAVGGLGLVGLGVSGYFALDANSLDDDSKQGGRCDADSACDPAGYALRKDAISSARVATIALVAGGALTAAGATLFIVGARGRAERDSVQLEARPAVLPGQAGLWLHGRF